MKYYESQQTELGFQFSLEVDKAVERIRANPEAGTPLSVKIRRRLLERFPYAIIYSLRPDRIRVLAVMHSSRRPGYWMGRL